MHDVQGSASETQHDFFTLFFDEYAHANFAEAPPKQTLPVVFVATWVQKHCSLAARLTATTDADQAHEITEFIIEEVAVVQAYATAWRGSGTVEAASPQNIADVVRAEAAKCVLPWPSISETPVPETSDGRLVKAHPLTFPTGCGDFRQP